MKRRQLLFVLASLALFGCNGGAPNEPAELVEDRGELTVSAEVALASLMALGDGELRRVATGHQLLAATDDVRSAEWERVRGPLGAADDLQQVALLWFALPDGSYWSVQEGKAEGNLSDRAYWPRLMAGETILGDLVISRATGRSSAIVAVPVLDDDGAVVGALGASVFLDELSARIDDEMNLAPDEIFYSFDEQPLVALNKDPDLVFFEPLEQDDAELRRAFEEMLSQEEGAIEDRFRDRARTVLYRRSEVSGWWYAFGVVAED